MNKTSQYYDLSDVLEYGNISDDEAINICDTIIADSLNERRPEVLESMYHALYTAITNRNIVSNIKLDEILNLIDFVDAEVLDYIISILALSGDMRYIKFVQQIGVKNLDLDVDEAIKELKAVNNGNI